MASTHTDLRRRLNNVRQLQIKFQAERDVSEKKLTADLEAFKIESTRGEIVFSTRVAQLRAKNAESRKSTSRLIQAVNTSTSPLAPIANELASLRELSERARSTPSAGDLLISKSQAAIDNIGAAAGRQPARPLVQSGVVATAAATAKAVVRSMEEESEEERAERLDESADGVTV